MKITDAVFYTDGTTLRLETDKGNFYMDNKKKFYDMHPVNIMTNQITGSLMEEIKKSVKTGKYNNDVEVKKWL